jgi:ABC-type tungstate transport system permease subunit
MARHTAIATARYNRYVTIEFDNGTDAKEFFYWLGEQMGYDPRKGKGHYPPGTGLDWTLRQLSSKHASKLSRSCKRKS